MYYLLFIMYLVIGFFITLTAFSWALKNGQFKDQQRARFLPLHEEDYLPPAEAVRSTRFEGYVLLGLMLFGLVACASVVIYACLA